MKEFKGTPGPWKLELPNVDGTRYVTDINGQIICKVIRVLKETAKAIAAVPQMLEALQEMVDVFGGRNRSASHFKSQSRPIRSP